MRSQPADKKQAMSKTRPFAFLVFGPGFLAGCALGGPGLPGRYQQLTAQSLSIMPDLRDRYKVCVFDPAYRVLHFPQWHFPINNRYEPEDFERISRSQFQLLHTILAYSKSRQVAVFDESVIHDEFDESYSQILQAGSPSKNAYTDRGDGRKFLHTERLFLARRLFGNGIPQYYEYLNQNQKSFLFNMGASFTLYFLGKIPRVYKVIERQDFERLRASLFPSGSTFAFSAEKGVDATKDYWIYDFREYKLREQISEFYRQNPGYSGVILIAYGINHDLSDEFAGFAFQAGSFCKNWADSRFFPQRRI